MTDNELIAEFMGLSIVKEHGKKYWSYNELFLQSETLDFDRSWDWLMPVIHKIYALYEDFDIKSIKDENLFLDVLDNPVKYPIYDTYHKVVTFIKWHNEQTKNHQ